MCPFVHTLLLYHRQAKHKSQILLKAELFVKDINLLAIKNLHSLRQICLFLYCSTSQQSQSAILTPVPDPDSLKSLVLDGLENQPLLKDRKKGFSQFRVNPWEVTFEVYYKQWLKTKTRLNIHLHSRMNKDCIIGVMWNIDYNHLVFPPVIV